VVARFRAIVCGHGKTGKTLDDSLKIGILDHDGVQLFKYGTHASATGVDTGGQWCGMIYPHGDAVDDGIGVLDVVCGAEDLDEQPRLHRVKRHVGYLGKSERQTSEKC